MTPSQEVFQTYLFRYRHAGKEWGFEIQATSLADANTRLSQMTFARYDGVLVASIKLPDRVPAVSKCLRWFASCMGRAGR
jgi:hypothetical protein